MREFCQAKYDSALDLREVDKFLETYNSTVSKRKGACPPRSDFCMKPLMSKGYLESANKLYDVAFASTTAERVNIRVVLFGANFLLFSYF